MSHILPHVSPEVMGHVKDTSNVHAIEARYGTVLIGASAKWKVVDGTYRVYVEVNGHWRGVFPMTADDLEVYE